MDRKIKVLFLCTGNSCRSQMAEGILRKMAGDRFEGLSAGLDPKEEVHPLAIKIMKEVGIDISGQKPKSVSTYLGKESIFYIIVVCNKAQQTCPRIWPGLGDKNRYYWPFDDPADATGTEDEKLEVFRRVRNEIKEKLNDWIKSH
jgi:arsenate reductase